MEVDRSMESFTAISDGLLAGVYDKQIALCPAEGDMLAAKVQKTAVENRSKTRGQDAQTRLQDRGSNWVRFNRAR